MVKRPLMAVTQFVDYHIHSLVLSIGQKVASAHGNRVCNSEALLAWPIAMHESLEPTFNEFIATREKIAKGKHRERKFRVEFRHVARKK